MIRFFRLFIAAVFLSFSGSSFAISNVNELIKTVDDVEITLLTVDRGMLPYMLAGHSLLRVTNKKIGQDLVFNWGIFDLKDPDLPFKVLKGQMTYRIGAWPFNLAFQHYVKREKRTVWQEKINLTSIQKASVLKQLNWWLSPENTHYQYVIRKNNCSTIIRDLLNTALGNKVKTQFGDILTESKYRDHVLEYFPLFSWAHFGFDLVASSELDQKITQWDYMYLPFNLQSQLKLIPAYTDGHAQKKLGEMLMSPTEVLNDGPKYLPPKISMWTMSAILLFVIAALAYFLHRKRSSHLIRLAGLVSIGWGTFSAIFSLILIVGWSYTTHVFTHHNANLFYLWVIDVIFIWVGFKMVFRPVKTTNKQSMGKFVTKFGLAHLVFLGLAVAGYITGIISQDMSYGLIYVAPHLLLVIGLQYVSFNSGYLNKS